MTDLISIIVPVYNGEKYIVKCMESLLQQTYRQIEIIAVNDGSTDESAKILDDYASKNERIHVVHQENKSLPQARFAGIQAATGAYIGFVDVDDWVEPDMFEILYNICNDKAVQIAACGVISEFGKKAVLQDTESEEIVVYNNIEALVQINQRQNVKMYIPNKLFQRNVFDGVEFTTGNFIGEDYYLITKILQKDIKVAWTSRALYHYLQADGTMSHKGFTENHKITFYKHKERCEELSKLYPQYKELFENYIMTDYLMLVVAMSRNKNYEEPFLTEIRLFGKKCRKSYCKASYHSLKFKGSMAVFCINYRFFIWGYRLMERVRYMLG